MRVTDKEKGGGLGFRQATGTTRAKQKDGTKERMMPKEKEKGNTKGNGKIPVRMCSICGRQGHDAAYCWQRVAAITEE